MPDAPRWRLEEQLWKLPAFALLSPPMLFVLAFLIRPFRRYLFDAFVLLGCLSPVLGVVTWAVLLLRYALLGEELDPGKITRRHVAGLAGLAIIAPVWLIVMYLIAVFYSGGR